MSDSPNDQIQEVVSQQPTQQTEHHESNLQRKINSKRPCSYPSF